MKKVLILTAPTGGGHDKAASNLEKLLENNGYEVHVINFLKEIHPSFDYVVCNSYKKMSLHSPKTFGRLYKISNDKYVNKQLSQSIAIVGTRKIKHAIFDIQPDIIISTHVLATGIIGKMKKRNKITMPFISVVTDFVSHRSYIDNDVDAYITGSDITTQSLINKGIHPNRIHTFGIPVDPIFYEKQTCSSDKFNVLIMGGHIGLGFIEASLKAIYEENLDVKCTVVCGKNEKLRKHLSKTYQPLIDSNHLEIIGFTNKVDELMDEANILISKPGGLTTSEAIVKNLPMIIPHVIPGQESENATFLVNSGAAIVSDKLYSIGFILKKIINEPDYYQSLKEGIVRLSSKYSNDDILELIDEMVS